MITHKTKCLWTFCLVWLGYGLSLVVNPHRERPGIDFLSSPFHLYTGFLFWGLVWIATAVFAAGGAIWPRNRIHWAFAVLWIAPFVQAMTECGSTAAWLVDHANGYEYGWVSSIPWIGFVLLVTFVAGWPDEYAVDSSRGVQM